MIELVHFGGQTIEGIENVPDEALPIVRHYEPAFNEDSVYADGLWTEFSSLPFEVAESLRDELIKAGFECEFHLYQG